MPAASPAETEEEAEARRLQHQQQREEYEAEQARRAEGERQQQEREDQEYEAKQVHKEQQRTARVATFERILKNAPESLSAAQLRLLLSAIVNLDFSTFVDDLAEELAEDNERRNPEDVLLATIEATSDDKLTSFAIRLALSGHVGIALRRCWVEAGSCGLISAMESFSAINRGRQRSDIMGRIAGSGVFRLQVQSPTFLGHNPSFHVQIVPERLMDKISRVEMSQLKIDRVDIVPSRSVHDSA